MIQRIKTLSRTQISKR